ncbi:MAG: hypothetical protein WBJ13_08945 [Sedimentibacter sp.]
MSRFIGIEDLAANALIALIEKIGPHCRKVSFEQLVNYGTVVVKILNQNKEDAVLLLSKDYTNTMIRNYSDFFEIEKTNPNDEYSEEFIVLREDKNLQDLRNHFRAFLSLEVALAFSNKDSLAELGVVA